MKKRLRRVRIYFGSMLVMISASQIFETTTVCIDHEDVLNNEVWLIIFLVKAELVILVNLSFNTLIAIVVLPQMRKNLGYTSMTIAAIFMLAVFELIMIVRIFIIACQNHMKQADNQGDGFKYTMIVYFTCCEMVLYMILIFEIMHQVLRMSGLNSRRK